MAVPPARNPRFRDREADLRRLQGRLNSERRVSLSGPPGVGKTELAMEYLHRCHAGYPGGVFWLRGRTAAQLRSDLAAMAWLPQLALEGLHPRVQRKVIEPVTGWLRSHDDWLLVIDELDKEAIPAIADLPATGHVLATSIVPGWQGPMPVEPMSTTQATALLLNRTGGRDRSAAAALAELLERLPLALEQASAFVVATGRDLLGYHELLRARLGEMTHAGNSDDQPSPVVATFGASFEQIRGQDSTASDILGLCAFLAPDDIPLSQLRQARSELPGDQEALERAVDLLERFSLADRQGDALHLHELVQAMTRELLGTIRRRRWLGAAIRLLRATFPAEVEDPQRWPLCARLLPHAQLALLWVEDHTLEPEASSWLLDRMGRYLEVRAEFALATPLTERALAIRERLHGSRHPDTATSVNNLGRLLRAQRDLAPARPLLERALAIRESVLGPDHPDTASSLNDLGRLLRAEGELAAARPLLERAVAIRESVLGPYHLDTAMSLNNLALVHKGQGDLASARQLLERVSIIRDKVLGPDHPSATRSRWRLEDVTAQLSPPGSN